MTDIVTRLKNGAAPLNDPDLNDEAAAEIERLRAALDEMCDAAGAERELYRHKKTGGVYEVICKGARESDGELLVVYSNTTSGERWIRPATEFNDGRFEKAS